MNWPKEATVVINGKELSEAQAMTLRVAVGSFAIQQQCDLEEGNTSSVELTSNYLRTAREIYKIMLEK